MLCSTANITKEIIGKFQLPSKIWRSIMTAAGSSHSEDWENLTDLKFEEYFDRDDIDGWELRKGMNEILGMDMVPHPNTILAAVKACRRINDYALAVRWLEGVKSKTGDKLHEIWPYLLQEIKPCLCELGVNTPEEMCYHRPELALGSVFEM